jgi:hypothetical protein
MVPSLGIIYSTVPGIERITWGGSFGCVTTRPS